MSKLKDKYIRRISVRFYSLIKFGRSQVSKTYSEPSQASKVERFAESH